MASVEMNHNLSSNVNLNSNTLSLEQFNNQINETGFATPNTRVEIGGKTFTVQSEIQGETSNTLVLTRQEGKKMETLLVSKEPDKEYHLKDHVLITHEFSKRLSDRNIRQVVNTARTVPEFNPNAGTDYTAQVRNHVINQAINNQAKGFIKLKNPFNGKLVSVETKKDSNLVKNATIQDHEPDTIQNAHQPSSSQELAPLQNKSDKYAAKVNTLVDQLCDKTIDLATFKDRKAKLLEKMADNHTPLSEVENAKSKLKLAEALVRFNMMDGANNFEEATEKLMSKYGITESDVTKESHIYGNEDRAKNKMLKRIILHERANVSAGIAKGSLAAREEITGYPASVVKACEKAFKHTVEGRATESTKEHLVDKFVIMPIKQGDKVTIFVKEAYISQGSFKTATFASDYFAITNKNERGTLADVRPTNFISVSPENKRGVLPRLSPENLNVFINKPLFLNPEFNKGGPIEIPLYSTMQESIRQSMRQTGNPTQNATNGSEVQEGTSSIDDEIQGTSVYGTVDLEKERAAAKANKEKLAEPEEDDGPQGTSVFGTVDFEKERAEAKANKEKLAELEDEDGPQGTSVFGTVDFEKERAEAKANKEKLAEPEDDDGPQGTSVFGTVDFEKERAEVKAKPAEAPTVEPKPFGFPFKKTISDPTDIPKEKLLNIGKEVPVLPEGLSEEDEEQLTEYYREIDISLLVHDHPHFVRYHTVTTTESGERMTVKEAAGYTAPGIKDPSDPSKVVRPPKLVVSMEELAKHLEKNQAVATAQDFMMVYTLFHQSAKALAYMHRNNLVHLDFKLDNVLIKPDGTAAVDDFGTTVTAYELADGDAAFAGTPTYMAPEAYVSRNDRRSDKTDVWAFGMALQRMHEKLTGDDTGTLSAVGIDWDATEQITMLTVGRLHQDPELAKQYNENYPEPEDKTSVQHLAWRCTRIDPKDRPSAEEIEQFMGDQLKLMEAELSGVGNPAA